MMKCLPILVLLLASLNARADYSLPEVSKRYVLLVDLQDCKIVDGKLVLRVNDQEYRYKIEQDFMQDRIYSDGLCCGGPDSCLIRTREVEAAIMSKFGGTLLVEICCKKDTSEFFVSYMKLFSAEVEFKRYFPKKQYYDTIALAETIHPQTAAEFKAELRCRSVAAIKALKAEK